MDAGTEGLIGRVATYVGDGHSFLRGYAVKIVGVITRPEGDADSGVVYRDDDELAANGGLDPDRDIIEVVPWLPEQGRWSWVSSDVRPADLADLRETP